MKRVLVVSILTFSVLMFASFAAFSATITPVGISKVKNTDLANLMRSFNRTAGAYDDAYSKAEKITHKNKNQTWVSVIEQARKTDIVDSVASSEIADQSVSTLESEVSIVIDNADYIGFNATKKEIAAMKAAITTALATAVEGSSDLRVYSGNYTGAFDTDFSFIAVIDTKNKQMVTIAGGYDE